MGSNGLEQTNALFRKNLVIQRRACKTNCCLFLFPLLLCSVIGGLQIAFNRIVASQEGSLPTTRLDCSCSDATVGENTTGGLACPKQCPLSRAPRWAPVLQIPAPPYRAVDDDDGGGGPFTGLPDAACRAGAGSCAATFLVTGANQSFVGSVMDNMIPAHDASVNVSTDISALADYVLADGDGYFMANTFFYPPGVDTYLQNKCTPNLTLSYAFQAGNETVTRDKFFVIEGQLLYLLITKE